MKNLPTIGAATTTNCTFEYECPKDWFRLMPTDAPDVRHCEACNKDVTFCADDARLLQMMRAGACVAVYSREAVTLTAGRMRLGLPRGQGAKIAKFLDELDLEAPSPPKLGPVTKTPGEPDDECRG